MKQEEFNERIGSLISDIYDFLAVSGINPELCHKEALTTALNDIEVEKVSPEVFDNLVSVYYKENIPSLEMELTLESRFDIDVNGKVKGKYQNPFTYQGTINWAKHEYTSVYNNGVLIDKPLDYTLMMEVETENGIKEVPAVTRLAFPDEPCIVLVETTIIDTANIPVTQTVRNFSAEGSSKTSVKTCKNMKVLPKIYIYLPINSPEGDGEVDEN